MDEKDKHIANRIVLGLFAGIASFIGLFTVTTLLASISPDNQAFLSFRLVIVIVGIAIFASDRIYVSRKK